MSQTTRLQALAETFGYIASHHEEAFYHHVAELAKGVAVLEAVIGALIPPAALEKLMENPSAIDMLDVPDDQVKCARCGWGLVRGSKPGTICAQCGATERGSQRNLNPLPPIMFRLGSIAVGRDVKQNMVMWVTHTPTERIEIQRADVGDALDCIANYYRNDK